MYNSVLLPNEPLEAGRQLSVKIIDWELAQLGVRPLDVGQIIAELWQLKLFKGIEAGVWILRGFAAGYGPVEKDFTFRTIIHVGAHLICFGSSVPGWGSSQQSKEVVKVGRDILLNAWSKDREVFKDHDLECLFA